MTEVEEQKPAEQDGEEKPSIIRPPTFEKLYATNSFVTSTDSDFRIELFNEKFQTEKGWVYQSEAMVILTKEAAKKMLLELTEKIKTYEKEHGEIPISEERLKFKYFL
jgi:hypothetical protein